MNTPRYSIDLSKKSEIDKVTAETIDRYEFDAVELSKIFMSNFDTRDRLNDLMKFTLECFEKNKKKNVEAVWIFRSKMLEIELYDKYTHPLHGVAGFHKVTQLFGDIEAKEIFKAMGFSPPK